MLLIANRKRSDEARSGMLAIVCAAFCCLLFGTTALHAQVLRARVVDSATAQAVGGVVVSALGSAGESVSRVITNEQGRFVIALPPAIRQLRIQRIGYRARVLSRDAIDLNSSLLDFAIQSVPTVLQPMDIAASASSCKARPDRAVALGLLAQVRDGLLAAVVARNADAAGEKPFMKFARFDHLLDGKSARRFQETVQIDSLLSETGAFRTARGAEQLLRDGFMMDSAGGRTLYGLDADILLSDAFTSGYCFHVASGNGDHRNQVGLGFAVAKSAKGRITIAGTVWVDTTARALHSIEYKYEGLSGFEELFKPGGLISYRTMPNGSVLIDRWVIRRASARIDALLRASRRSVVDAHETGGQLLRARWPDGTSWNAELASTLVNVQDVDGKPVAGVWVVFDSTGYGAKTDASGTATITDVLPRTYRVFVTNDPRGVNADFFVQPEALATAPLATFEAKGTSRFAVNVVYAPTRTVAGADAFAARLVSASVTRGARGTAFDSLHNRQLSGAMLTVEGTPHTSVTDSVGVFQFDSLTAGNYAIGIVHPMLEALGISAVTNRVRVVKDEFELRVGIPSFATFWHRACGDSPVPADSGYVFGTVRNLKGDGVANARVTVGFMDVRKDSVAGIRQRQGNGEVRTDSTGAYVICGTPADLDLQLVADRDSISTDLLTLPVSSERIRRQDFLLGESNGKKVAKGTVRGVVRYKDSGLPVIGARVLASGGPETRATAKGEFVLNDVPVGTRQIEVLAVGVTPYSMIIDVEENPTKSVSVALERVTTLATRDVNGVRSLRAIQINEMELRRERGMGAFFDSTAVRQYPNLKAMYVSYAMPQVTRRQICRLYVDGVDMMTTRRGEDVGQLMQEILPQEVAMFEYHARGTTAPVEFKCTSGQDVIVIWTKRGLPSR